MLWLQFFPVKPETKRENISKRLQCICFSVGLHCSHCVISTGGGFRFSVPHLSWFKNNKAPFTTSETSLQLNVVNCLFPPKKGGSCTLLTSVATSPCNNIHSAMDVITRRVALSYTRGNHRTAHVARWATENKNPTQYKSSLPLPFSSSS